MQSLLVLQSLRSMLGHGQEQNQPKAIEAFVTRIAAEGYDGLGIPSDGPFLHHLTVELLRERGLTWEAQCYPQTVEDLKPVLEVAGTLGAHHVNLQPDVRSSSVKECVRYLEGWQRLADDAGLVLMVETHRNRMTNDLLFTLDLLDALPRLKLTGDIAHYVVAREMWLPLAEDNSKWMNRLLDRCWSFHGRVGSSEQIQLPLHFPRTRPWLDQFTRWWDYGFTGWRQRAAPEDSLTFLCEIVPPPYALTDAEGNEFSDRWEESRTIMGLVRSLWEKGEGSQRSADLLQSELT